MSRYVIISGGDFTDAAELRPDDHIIACDRGCGYAARLGVTPELIIGDFDSYSGPLPAGVPVLRLPCEKDDTDTMHAVRCAVERGCGELLLTCALGGRLDHALANIQCCAYAAERGVDVSIADGSTEIRLLRRGSITLPRMEGRALSLLSLTERCTGVCESGVKYPLTDAVLTSSFPLGVSNEWAAPEARISVESGILLIIMSKK